MQEALPASLARETQPGSNGILHSAWPYKDTASSSMNTADNTVAFLDLPRLAHPLSDLPSLTDVCWLLLEARAGLGDL